MLKLTDTDKMNFRNMFNSRDLETAISNTVPPPRITITKKHKDHLYRKPFEDMPYQK